MENKIKKTLIITLVTALIFGGFSPMFAVAETGLEKVLSIAWVYPSSVLEGTIFFQVKVVDQANNPIEDATVMVETMGSEETNGNGIASFLRWKTVNTDTYFLISAGKPGWTFDGDEKTILVRNKVLHFYPDPPECMDEQTPVTVTVLDQDDDPFVGALVTFGDDWDTTGLNGQATVDAPDVTGNQYVQISASFGIYESAIDYILVNDTDDTPSTIHCYVYNASSSPTEWIEGAIVTIIQGGEGQNITDENGYCSFTVYPDELYGTVYVLKAEAAGYDDEVWKKRLYADMEYTHYFGLSPSDKIVVSLQVTEINDLTVAFQAYVNDPAMISSSYLWLYGDETFEESEESSSTHEYLEIGYYNVEVIATIITPWGFYQENDKIGLCIEE